MVIVDRFAQRIVTAKHVGDIVYDSNTGDDIIDQEDILVIGDWSDFTGSAVVSTTAQTSLPLPNELHGTLADLQGAKVTNLTDRGKTSSLYRQRRIKRYMKLD